MKTTHTKGQAAAAEGAPALESLVYTLDEARQLLGIGRSLAYELAQTGEFPGVRHIGRRYVVSKAAFHHYLDGGSVAQTATDAA